MIKVEKVSFLKPDKYKDLIEKYNSILHTEKQIIYSYNLKENFRFIQTKRYCQLCVKSNDLEQDVNSEKNVIIENKYASNMHEILNVLNYIPTVKWYRTRSKASLDFGIELYLDYIVGYGYMIKLLKTIEDEEKVDTTKIELGNLLESLDINITTKEEINKKYEEYILNWDRLTQIIDEESFLK